MYDYVTNWDNVKGVGTRFLKTPAAYVEGARRTWKLFLQRHH